MDVRVLIAISIAALVAAFITHRIINGRFAADANEARRREARKKDAQAQKERTRNAKLRRLGERALALVPVSRAYQQGVARALKRAGVKATPGTYWAAVLIAALAGLLFGLTAAGLARALPLAARVAIVAGCTALAAIAPRLYIRAKTRKRREQIEAALPGILELLSVVVGAGQTVERGIKTIGQRADGPLAEEFAQVDAGITNFGYSAGEALSKMAERMDVPQVSLFCMSVSQSIEAGSSMSAELRNQAAVATDKYYRKVEEKSNKIRTKMIFPTVFLILPPVFIAVLVPMAMRLAESASGLWS